MSSNQSRQGNKRISTVDILLVHLKVLTWDPFIDLFGMFISFSGDPLESLNEAMRSFRDLWFAIKNI